MDKDFSKLIYAVAKRYANSREDFEDLVQEGYVALMELLKSDVMEKLKKHEELASYVKNRLPAMVREKAKKLWRYAAETRYDFREEWEQIEDPRVLREFEIVDILTALEKMVKKDMQIIKYMLQGKNQKEIGQILGMSQQAISKKLNNIKTLAKDLLC